MQEHFLHKLSSLKYPILLVLTTIFGFILRLANISPNKFYPDAYQSLLVANNIRTYHNVVGFLGDGGLLFPPYFAWSRPGYPLLINFVNLFTANDSIAAQIVAVIAGVASIVIAYYLSLNIFGVRKIALLTSFLLAISFNHVVWGGFILTETTAVFIVLLVLWNLFSSFKKAPTIADYKDILSGILITCAVLTRYEYALLIPPIIFLIFKNSPKPLLRIVNIFSAALVFLIFVVIQIFPLNSLGNVILEQVGDQISRGLGILLFLTIFAGLLWLSHKNKFTFIPDYSLKLFVYSIVSLLIFITVGFPYLNAQGIKEYFQYDFVTGIFFLIGIILLSKNRIYQNTLLFFLISAVILSVTYFRIDTMIERYWTHIIPFIIFPAGYGLFKTYEYLKQSTKYRSTLGYTIIGIIIIFQTFLTYSGLKQRMNGEWFRQSYEEKSAIVASNYIPHSDETLLIVSMPEPYFYNSRLPTQSISNNYPYIFMDNSNNSKTAYIIVDAGMREYFPDFTAFIDKNLHEYIYKTYYIDEAFHVESASISSETYKTVHIYKVPVINLIYMIGHVTF